MAVTRIKNNQITDATITYAKIAPGTLVGSLFNPDLTIASNISITGNLSVTGNTTTINAINTLVNDPLVIFNNGYVGTPAYDVGVLINRNLGALESYGGVNTAWIWRESDGEFQAILTTETGDTQGTINRSYFANVQVGNLKSYSSVITGPLTAGTTNFASINDTPIGNAVPSTGAFTTLTASSNVTFTSSNVSENYGAGALVVTGGVGVGGNIYSGGALVSTNGLYTTSEFNGTYTDGIAIDYTTGLGRINIGGADGLKVYNSFETSPVELLVIDPTGNVVIPVTTSSDDTTTGALVVAGGVGVAGNINVGTNLNVTGTTVLETTLDVVGETTLSTANVGGLQVKAIGNVTPGTGDFTNLVSTDQMSTTLVATNFSSGNISVSGGSATGLTDLGSTNAGFATAVATNFSSGNVYLAGGYIDGLANVQATDGVFTTVLTTNFSTANAVIKGGYIDAVSNVYATTARFTNLSSGNVILKGGYVDNVAIGANTAATGKFTTLQAAGNVVLGDANKGPAVTYTQGVDYSAGAISVNAVLMELVLDPTKFTNTDAYNALLAKVSGSVTISGSGQPTTSITFTSGVWGDYITYKVMGFTPYPPTGWPNSTIDITSISFDLAGGEASTSTTTGALVVTGGTGISGNLNLGGSLNVAGATSLSTLTIGGLQAKAIGNVTPGTGAFTTLTTGGFQAQAIGNVTPGTGNFTDLYTTNFSTANAYISGGHTTGLVDVQATTGLFTNLSTGNALITGGQVTGLSGGTGSTSAGTTQTLRVSSGGLAVTGDSYLANSLGINENLTVAGWANITNTTQSVTSADGALVVAGGVGIAQNLNVGGDVEIVGNLTVQGDVTTLNTSTLSVEDLNITIAKNATTPTQANTAGITVAGADATLQYIVDYDAWASNKTFLAPFVGATDVDTTNIHATNANITNSALSNVLIGSGTIYATDFSSGNAQITGGYTTGLTDIEATTGLITNLSSSNVIITGGYIDAVANVYATDARFTNVSAANVIFTGGYLDNVAIGANTAATGAFTTLSVTDTTQSTSTISGALTVAGGVGVDKGIWSASLNTQAIGNVTPGTGEFTKLWASGFANVGKLVANGEVKSATLNVTGNVFLKPQDGDATVAINPLVIGTMDNMVIGATLASNVYATNLRSTTSLNAKTTGPINLQGGTGTSTIDNIKIGSVVPSTGVFTTLSATTWANVESLTVNAVTVTDTLSANHFASADVNITGGNATGLTNLGASNAGFTTAVATNFSSGNAQITGGYADNFAIGANTAATGAFTTLTASGALVASTLNKDVQLGASTGTGQTVINSGATGSIDNIAIGATTPSTGKFTTLQSTSTTTLGATTAFSLNNTPIGGTTANTANVSTLTAQGVSTLKGNVVVTSSANPDHLNNQGTVGALVLTNGGAAIDGNTYIGQGATINGGKTSNQTVIRGTSDDTLFTTWTYGGYEGVLIGGSATVGTTTVAGSKLLINSTDSIVLPVGTTAERPGSAGYTDVAGMLRYNSTINQIEFYDGLQWNGTGSSFTIITDSQFSDPSGNPSGNVDGSNTDFTLPGSTTTSGCIVSINGVLQLPSVAYSVISGGTVLRFTEAPAIGDIVDVRILTTTSSPTTIASSNGFNQFIADNTGLTFWTGASSTTLTWKMEPSDNGDLIPIVGSNIGNVAYPVNNFYVSNIHITGGAITGVSLGGGSLDDVPIGANIQNVGAFTTLTATTWANVESLNVNTVSTFGSDVTTTGNLSVTGTTTLTGDVSVTGTLSVDGNTSGHGMVYDETPVVATASITTIIDSFDKLTYRTAKYIAQLSDDINGEFQSTELMLVHNGTTPSLETYAVTFTGSSAPFTFSANVSGDTVNLLATNARSADFNAKVFATMIKI